MANNRATKSGFAAEAQRKVSLTVHLVPILITFNFHSSDKITLNYSSY